VRGKSTAVCGFAKNGAPPNVCGFHSGKCPERISSAAWIAAGWKSRVTSDSRGFFGETPGFAPVHGISTNTLSAGDITLPGTNAWARTTKGRASRASEATTSRWLRPNAARRFMPRPSLLVTSVSFGNDGAASRRVFERRKEPAASSVPQRTAGETRARRS